MFVFLFWWGKTWLVLLFGVGMISWKALSLFLSLFLSLCRHGVSSGYPFIAFVIVVRPPSSCIYLDQTKLDSRVDFNSPVVVFNICFYLPSISKREASGI